MGQVVGRPVSFSRLADGRCLTAPGYAEAPTHLGPNHVRYAVPFRNHAASAPPKSPDRRIGSLLLLGPAFDTFLAEQSNMSGNEIGVALDEE
jgi:hypothetical protein